MNPLEAADCVTLSCGLQRAARCSSVNGTNANACRSCNARGEWTAEAAASAQNVSRVEGPTYVCVPTHRRRRKAWGSAAGRHDTCGRWCPNSARMGLKKRKLAGEGCSETRAARAGGAA